MPEASKTRKNEAKATVIFDRDSLSHRLMDDIELMKQVVEHFTLDMPEQLELLQQAILDSDTEAIARLAHKVRGAAGNLAAEEMTACALRLEKAAKSETQPAPQKLMEDLSDSYQRLVHVLNTELQR